MYPVYVSAMGGLGDSIYQRPFVRLLAERYGEVYLKTPWPELFEDLPGVRFVYPEGMGLRTQAKNMARQPAERWSRPPARAARIRPRYMLKAQGVTILQELANAFGVGRRGPLRFDLPDFGRSPVRYKRYAVVRPVTIRKEWQNVARAPDPQYVVRASALLRGAGFRVVSVADVDGVHEWLKEPGPVADQEFHAGELPAPDLLALVQGAAVIVGGVGWIVPAAIAAGVPAVFVGGGQGGHNAPWVVTDRRMDTSRVRWLLPDEYCRCYDQRHGCPKGIADFDARFLTALEEVAPRQAREAA